MKFKPLSLNNVKTYPLKKRQSKVSVRDFGSKWIAGSTMSVWLESLPNILAGNDLRKLVNRLQIAVKERKIIMLAMGAHTIKVGLSPIILDYSIITNAYELFHWFYY